MVNILKIGTVNSKKTLPIVNKPVLSYNYLKMLNPQKRTNQTPQFDLFGEMKKKIEKGFEKVEKAIEKVGDTIEKAGIVIESVGDAIVEEQEKKLTRVVESYFLKQEAAKNTVKDVLVQKVTNTEASLEAEKRAREQKELQDAQSQFYKLRDEYQLLLGTQKAVPSYTSALPQLKRNISYMQESIEQEKLLLSLEKTFRKGADGYDPKRRKPFVLSELEPIVIDEKKKFEDEILRVTKIFILNSFKVDKSLTCFNEVSKEFFKESASSLREIYAIKDEFLMKIAERIPFLGVVPKALRVNEQVRLTKCIVKDYRDVAEKYVKKGMDPYIDEYNKQYQTILDYVLKNLDTYAKEKLSEKCMDKIKEIQDLRFKVSSKLIEGFAYGGKKIVDACNDVEKNGKKEVVTKALFTIVGLI